MTKVELGRDPAEERRIALELEGAALDDALARVEDHANPSWVLFARRVVEEVARAHRTFISDDVWAAGLGKPPEARALGAVMRWARAEGLIEPTNEYRPSAQAGVHMNPVRVWRSRIYEEPPT